MVVPKKDVVYLDMPVEEAMKMVISMGVLSPDDPVAFTARAIAQEPVEGEPSKSAEG
jgi:uncharacterized membrane protein